MVNHRILSALCYFSVVFFPLLIPFIIYVVTDQDDVKHHAKRSFISHLIPVFLLLAGLFIFSLSFFSIEKRMMSMLEAQFDFWMFAPFLFTTIYSVLFIAIFIWNVYYGIKVLKE